MGSGRGKTRRAQALVSQAAKQTKKFDAAFQEDKWKEFVRDSGLRKVNLQQYYLGKIVPNLTDSEAEVIITNLFNDAVLVGAITLPANCVSDDFQFFIETDRTNMR